MSFLCDNVTQDSGNMLGSTFSKRVTVIGYTDLHTEFSFYVAFECFSSL
jgi:hypothetical protein